ncbi:MAG: hypothetical protein ABI823_03950 [Bryobacteraceae bacterium]
MVRRAASEAVGTAFLLIAGRRHALASVMCYGCQVCPLFPNSAAMVHHSFEDPAAVEGPEEERLAAFRRVRDEIRQYLKAL